MPHYEIYNWLRNISFIERFFRCSESFAGNIDLSDLFSGNFIQIYRVLILVSSNFIDDLIEKGI